MITQYSHKTRRLNDAEAVSAPRRAEKDLEAKEILMRIVLPVLLLYAACCLAAAREELARAERLSVSLRAELAAAERENLALREKLAEGFLPEELEELARERLGLVLPGEKIFLFSAQAEQSRQTERDMHGVADRRNP